MTWIDRIACVKCSDLVFYTMFLSLFLGAFVGIAVWRLMQKLEP